jgi:hypothetical protein
MSACLASVRLQVQNPRITQKKLFEEGKVPQLGGKNDTNEFHIKLKKNFVLTLL